MAKYVVLAIATLTLAGCYSNPSYEPSAAAGGSGPAREVVRVQLDTGEVRDFPTDHDLRAGDRVQLLTDGKVAPR